MTSGVRAEGGGGPGGGPAPRPLRRPLSLPAGWVLALAALPACDLPDRSVPGIESGRAHRVVETDAAPPAVGPYSQALLVGNTLYLAGQIGLDPTTGEMVEGGVTAETRQVMENLGAVLAAAGFSFRDVVQSQVFLADLDEFGEMNDVYGRYFGEAPPARATVEAGRLPLDARVEIMMTAVRGGDDG